MVKGCPNLGYYAPKSDGQTHIEDFKIQTPGIIKLEYCTHLLMIHI